MLARILAGVRAATRRMMSDWTVVAAAFATIVLAATLLSAGPIYGEAITISAFDRAMRNAPPSESALSISARPFTEDFEAVDAILGEQVAQALSPARAPITAIARASILEMSTDGGDFDLVETWHVSGIEEKATLEDGRWPAAEGTVEIALPVAVAEQLSVSVGDTVTLSPRSADTTIETPVVGVFTFNDITEPAWFADPMVAEGSVVSAGDQIFGPLIAGKSAVLNQLFTDRVRVTWRVTPDFRTLDTGYLSSFTTGLSRLEADLNARLENESGVANPEAVTFTLVTSLGDRLGTITQSLSVTNSTILAVILQLSLLALYALILTSRLVVDTRTAETALARSRGASPAQMMSTAVIEGLVLVLPAVLMAPPLAALLIRALNRFGPLASIGLTIDPSPNMTAYGLAAAAALLALITLVWPAYRAARAFPDPEGKARRQSGRSTTQRLGIDLVLVALLVIAVWQLEQLGPRVSATVRGRFGVDPLLVVAPVLGLAAGVILAMRVVPRLARLAERMVGSRVPVVPALALWQVARRPNRYARSALLLMTTVALGVFASSFSSSWIGSQQDQADHRVGADLRFVLRNTPDTIAPLHMRPALEDLPGVVETLPVSEIRGAVAGNRQARFVITDTASFAAVAKFRPDLARDLDALVERMLQGRVSLPSVPLPGQPARLTMTWEATELPSGPEDEVEPCPAGDLGFSQCFHGEVSLVVQDGHGSIHRLPAGEIRSGLGPMPLEVEFLSPDGQAPEYPLTLVDIELLTPAGRRSGPSSGETPRLARVSLLSAEVHDLSGTDSPLKLDRSNLAVDWYTPRNTEVRERPTVAWKAHDDALFAFEVYPGFGLRRNLPGVGDLIIAVTPNGPPLAKTFPVVATDALADEGVWEVGMRVSLRPLGLGAANAEIIGTIPAFPGVGSTPPLIMLVDLPTVQALRFVPGEPIDGAQQMWLATDGDGVVTAISQPPFRASAIVDRDTVVSELTSDPIALGTVGAFAIGFVAAAVFAVIGFTISALVSARERQVEFSLLHALGLDRGQLSRWLLLEQAVLVLISIGLGLAVGLAIGELILPLVTLNQDGSPAVPPLLVRHAWSTIWGFLLTLLTVLAVSIAVLIVAVARRGVGAGLRFGDEK